MAIEAEALLALSEKAEPGEAFVDGDKLRLVATPKGSTYIGDQVTVALCACGPKAMSNATLLAELWNGYRDGSLIHRSALAEDTARAVEGWQPIETAPRDGRPIWAYLYNSGIRLVRWWSCEDFAAKYGGEPDAFEPGFYEINDDSEGWSPKHWMPASLLPAPPALPLTKEAAR